MTPPKEARRWAYDDQEDDLVVSDDGGYVLHSDYARAVAECERLEAEVERLRLRGILLGILRGR